MFSVYGRTGRLFRGSMEELRKIAPTTGIRRTRRIASVLHEPLDAGLPGMPASPPPASQPGSVARPDSLHRDAMAAYAQTAQGGGGRHPLTQVRDIMHAAVFTVSDDTTVAQAWEALSQRQLGQAPVVNGRGVLVGLLTRAELLRADRLPAPGARALVWQALLLQSVAELMWTPVPSVAPDTDIRRLAQVLLDTGFPGLPVVDEQGRVSAFVSRTDVLRAVVADPPLDLWT